jgi:hypothetical protein
MNPRAPIVIIGCGRSGSTLLDRILNAHAEIHMLGEANFLAARLWELLGSSSDGSQWTSADRRAYENRHLFRKFGSDRVGTIASDREWTDSENRRLATIVRHSISELFSLASLEKRHWGMKEIWNGGSENVDWATYDAVFPEATWVHLLRHPLGYVRSAVGWSGVENSPGNVRAQLEIWARTVGKARERSACGRYVEIRYEDLLESPRETLAPVLNMLGLEWDTLCYRPLGQNWVATKQLPQIDPEQFQKDLESLGLMQILTTLGYRATESTPQLLTSYSRSVEYDKSGNLIITPQIQKGVGPYWIFALSTAPAVRDALEMRSGAQVSLADFSLHEDGRPLRLWENPSDFYRSPPGYFFCNAGAIFFTASDGSDPLTNGHCYSISPP